MTLQHLQKSHSILTWPGHHQEVFENCSGNKNFCYFLSRYKHLLSPNPYYILPSLLYPGLSSHSCPKPQSCLRSFYLSSWGFQGHTLCPLKKNTCIKDNYMIDAFMTICIMLVLVCYWAVLKFKLNSFQQQAVKSSEVLITTLYLS